MGHRKEKYLRKQRQQLINKQENKKYYQNGSEWHSGSTEREITDRRKLDV